MLCGCNWRSEYNLYLIVGGAKNYIVGIFFEISSVMARIIE